MKTKKTIYLIRHGETEGNIEGLFRGRYDFSLNENGRKQANLLKEALINSGIKQIFLSPLKRAKETATIINQGLNVPLFIEDAFNNIDLGEWEGKSKNEIARKYPTEFKIWKTEPEKLKFKDFELLENVQKRSLNKVLEIVEKGPDTLAIVTHRAVLKPLIAGLIGIKSPYFWKIFISPASYSTIIYEQNNFYLYNLNVTCHLKNFLSKKGD